LAPPVLDCRSGSHRGRSEPVVPSGLFNSALLGSLISPAERERQEVEINDLPAGLAAAGPALEDRLHQQHGLGECQAGRG
jgi:hypothetical protein